MTQEEKAQRYDEAIKIAKDSFNYPSYPGFIRADVVFPELKESDESEDERIRKALIEACKQSLIVGGFHKDKVIAWLEKQAEQVLANSCKTCRDEQKSADKVEPKFKVGDKIIDKSFPKNVFTVTEVINDGIAYVDKNGERFTKYYDEDDWDEYELVEQKPVWSEEDEEIHRKCICAMRASACGFPEEEKFVEQVDNWFKFIKEKVQPQPKQEWSEEDKYYCNIILALLNNEYVGCADKRNAIEWFKSLKERYTWKPSDEQMEMLNEVLNFAANHESSHWNDYIFGILNNLINQLKKLKL